MASVEVCSLHIGTYPMGNFNPAPDWVGCKQFLKWDTCVKTERTENERFRKGKRWRGRERESLRPILLWQEAVTEWRGLTILSGFINLGHMAHTNKKLQQKRKRKRAPWRENFQNRPSSIAWFNLKFVNIKLTDYLIRRRDILSKRQLQ